MKTRREQMSNLVLFRHDVNTVSSPSKFFSKSPQWPVWCVGEYRAMQTADVKIMVPVDGDDSSLKAVSLATKLALEKKKEGKTVAVVLVNFYSSWDISSNEENDGKLAIDQAESYVASSGLKEYVVVTEESGSIKNDMLNLIQENSIDIVVVGSTSYSGSSDPDSWISNAWSSLVNTFSTPLPQHLQRNATCQVILVSATGDVVPKNS